MTPSMQRQILLAKHSAWFHDMAEIMSSLYRHKKTGGIYGVICFATREADGEPIVVYRNIETGDRWVRPASEFNDGRFEIIGEQP